jgi:hypothetical protein
VEIRINPVGDSMTSTQDKKYAALIGPENFLWLGHGRGKYLALFPVTSTATLTTTTTTTAVTTIS